MLEGRVLIVDDEKIARDRIRRMLGIAKFAGQIEEAENAIAGLRAVIEFKPTLILLDVQMPGLDGFDFLGQVEHRDFKVVFQTAHDEFAVKAFDESAIDYLLKPFTQERFEKALRKAAGVGEIDRIEHFLKKKERFLEKLVSRVGGKVRLIDVADIICFQSKDHCTLALTGGQEFILDQSLEYLANCLDPSKFLRCHRSAIVALARIKSIGSSNDRVVTMENGISVPLARALRAKIIEEAKGAASLR